jgi:prepilin-type N-terminal cleavage/methylation domain-containing protein
MKICDPIPQSSACQAFTLVEVLIALLLMAVVLAGVFYSYVQADRFAEWSSMSLAAQSYAAQGLEQARSAQWDSESISTNGDELPPTNSPTTPVFTETDTLDVPQTGAPLWATNNIYVTTNQASPPLRELKSVVTWTFPLTNKKFTNVAVTLRAPDE